MPFAVKNQNAYMYSECGWAFVQNVGFVAEINNSCIFPYIQNCQQLIRIYDWRRSQFKESDCEIIEINETKKD